MPHQAATHSSTQSSPVISPVITFQSSDDIKNEDNKEKESPRKSFERAAQQQPLPQVQLDLAEGDRSNSSSRISSLARVESNERKKQEKRKRLEKIVREMKEQISLLEEELNDL
jgi:hypothetical protein